MNSTFLARPRQRRKPRTARAAIRPPADTVRNLEGVAARLRAPRPSACRSRTTAAACRPPCAQRRRTAALVLSCGVLPAIGQERAEPAPCVEHPGLHRVHRTADDPCDLAA